MTSEKEQDVTADILVIGGGLGGTAAALAAAKAGMRVVMTEETDWIGGQLTTQAVPPDEHRWIEQCGCTASYREFRERVRRYYRDHYPLTEQAANNPLLNPGNGWVSRLAHEPRVALRVLQDMLAPYVNSGRIRIMYETMPVRAVTAENRVEAVVVRDLRSGTETALTGRYVLDATECGDLLTLTGTEYVIGAESRSAFLEPHAPEAADPFDVQAITHVAAVDYVPGGNFTITEPEQYRFWKSFIPTFSAHPLLSWYATDADDTTRTKRFTLFPNGQGIVSLWDYRRILDPANLAGPLYDGELTLLNWPQNDYFLGSVVDVPFLVRKERLEAARQLTLSLVYWLQTDAPRLDGGKGFSGIRLRGDVLGTKDGLAKSVYIRESRRIQAMTTVTEHDVSKELRGGRGIKRLDDSVGVGSYHLDLHHTTASNRSFYIPNYPYEIPLGALLPIRMKNVLPACKNIGTTQISNGCFRLHPTEWNIGEAAGLLASYCVINGIAPHDVKRDMEQLERYQKLLTDHGVELHWPESVETEVLL
ncbi:FAD-dependent oxidoreductase [Paenibacillus beijingensis]|uniref:FAD-dependent oxidoreductase n=1 Tax=Paenibacillus beijingensis TaxID=1126833 RepID=A0A0D5NGH5_9BACL|nr:FAD-dependent oxidoreductase [Paenibacillus beijingensis]AJY74072.1 FAD-dependent oxidoreductase [Paenibacillus beijingensis]